METARFYVLLLGGFIGALLSIAEGAHGSAVLGGCIMIMADSRR
jgi:hypothetical protein